MEHLKSNMIVTAAQRSTRGIKARNEDSIGILIPGSPLLTTKGVAAVVSDGVSEAEFSKEASDTSVQSFLTDYYATPETWSVKSSAHKVLVSLNRWLYSHGCHLPKAQRGYVCTFSAIILKSRVGHLFHVGDTRIYRIRDGAIEQLTNDHASFISATKTCLSRAMGIGLNLEVDYKRVDLMESDRFLLTSDGLHDFLKESEMLEIVTSYNKEEACNKLIESALRHGSDDNLSCQILSVDQLGVSSQYDIYHKLSALPFPPQLEVGSVIDHFRVEQEIHASSRSTLYLVTDQLDQQRYVLKAPSPNYSDDPAYIDRFIQEEWVGCRIKSDYVVSVVVPERPKTSLYHIMEHVDGTSLAEWMQQNEKPDIAEVVDIISGVVRGIRAFHRKETLHQDIKPDNIILNHQNRPVIIDFGSTYIAGIEEINCALERDMLLGTEGFIAPEYLVGRAPSYNADLFSIGVLTYQLLTGKLPYGERYGKQKTLQALTNLSYTPSYHYNPMVPVWLDGAIQKAVQINPQLRYQQLSEFVYDLKNPNPKYLNSSEWSPLIDRNPLLFWKGLSIVLVLTNLLSIYWLL